MKKLTGIRISTKVEKFVKNEMKSFQQHPVSSQKYQNKI